jgi:hypothetical protein
MRALASLLVALFLASTACYGTDELPADADVCARATDLFASCGVVVPTLSRAPCTGAARLVARCVVDHASGCDGLAKLSQRLDACVGDQLDAGDLLPPPSDLPVPLADEPGAGDAGDGGPTSLVGDQERATSAADSEVMT